MTGGRARVSVIGALAVSLCCSPASNQDMRREAHGGEGPATEVSVPGTVLRSVWSGVYSSEQAARGREAYVEACSECHLPDLSGNGVAPTLRGDPFLVKRSGSTVGDLYALVRSTMPENQPFSLTPQTYVDIVAYLLKENELPPGSSELDVSQPFLDLIAFDAQP